MKENRRHEQLKRISIICHENNAHRKRVQQRRFNIIFCHTKRKGRRRPNCRTSDPHGTLLIDREQARDKFVGSPLRGHPVRLSDQIDTQRKATFVMEAFLKALARQPSRPWETNVESNTSRDLGKISVGKNWYEWDE